MAMAAFMPSLRSIERAGAKRLHPLRFFDEEGGARTPMWETRGTPESRLGLERSRRAAHVSSMGPRVRPAAVAGRFYPGSRDELARTVDALLEQAGPGKGP